MTADDICRQFEGLRLKAYTCPAGVWTIGYGHTRDVKPGQVINEEQADALLSQDLNLCRSQVRQVLHQKVTVNQFEALTSFCFNCGIGNLRGSTLLRKVNVNPADESIRAEFMKWIKAKGEVLPGLIVRRETESNLYFSL